MNEARVPKWMADYPELVVWAFRRGVTHAIWNRTGRVLPSFEAYVQAPKAALALADRVRMVWLRRHPVEESRDSGTATK